MKSEFQDFKHRISLFNMQLSTCRFAGELCLDEEELPDFSEKVIRYEEKLTREESDIATLVLAVNVAYYFYDDNGFWYHYNKITGNDNFEMTGRSIERTLCRYNLLSVQRSGPFRYVGAILEQCGISKRYIPAYSFLLKELKGHYRGNQLLELKYSDFVKYLRDYICPKSLKEFLLDEEGAMLTLQVLRMIKMYEDGVLSKIELSELDGFRPGFWEEVLKYYNSTPSERKTDLFFQKPELRLNLSDRVFELVFPSMLFLENSEKIRPFSYPITRIEKLQDLRENYSGQITSEYGQHYYWEIPGWRPNGDPVMFDGSRRNLIVGNQIVYPGVYYLIAPSHYIVPAKNLISLLGDLNITLEESYWVYKISIDFDDRMSNIKIASKNECSIVRIAFKNPGKYIFPYHIGQTEVFVGDIPDIEVSDFTLIEENKVGLFYDFGEIKGRIRNRNHLDILKYKARSNIPFKGKIWLENIVRNRFDPVQRGSSELFFYVIPDIKINFKQSFWGYATRPVISIEKSSQLKMNIHGAFIKDDEYFFSPQTKKITGEILLDQNHLLFEIPLERVGIIDENGMVNKYIERSELSGKNFVFLGPPEKTVELRLDNNSISLHLDNKGRERIDGAFIARCLNGRKGYEPIGVVIDEEKNDLGLWIIDSDFIFGSKEWSHSTMDIDGPINQILDVVALIKKQKLSRTIRINQHVPFITKEFNRKLDELFACSQIFDNVQIVLDTTNFDWFKLLESGPLKTMLEAYSFGEWSDFFNFYRDYFPNVERWNHSIENHIINHSPDRLHIVIKEWAEEVKAHKIINFSTSIANKQYGPALTQAWVSYRIGRVQEALTRINVIPDECSSIVGSLCLLLKLIIFLRRARFNQVKSLIYTLGSQLRGLSKDLTPIFEALTHALCGEQARDISISQSTYSFIEILPFTNEDSVFLAGFTSYLLNGDLKELRDNFRDWLVVWTVICIDEDVEYWDEIKPMIDTILVDIPSSPVKQYMIDKIQNKFKRSK